jgi:uncharacterized protein (TIGR02271 family)
MMTERSPYSGREIFGELGEIDLYSNDAEKIGRILEVHPQFLVVERGGFLSGKSEYFIAREYVASESGDRWTLSVGKDELDTIGSDERPEMRADPQGFDETRAAGRRTAQGDTETIQVHEEELHADKTAHQAGEVSVTKNVVEETKTIEVPVMREEVRVERHAASDTATSDHPDAFSGESIRVPVMEEQVEVRKVPHAVEEIEISKVQTQDTETVSDTVRKERVDIDDGSDTTRRR